MQKSNWNLPSFRVPDDLNQEKTLRVPIPTAKQDVPTGTAVAWMLSGGGDQQLSHEIWGLPHRKTFIPAIVSLVKNLSLRSHRPSGESTAIALPSDPVKLCYKWSGWDEKYPYSLRHLTTWFPVSATIWWDLGDGAFLEEVWHVVWALKA